MRKRINIVTCAYNEQDCIDELARRLQAMFDAVPRYEFDVIAVDNGSDDSTFERLVAIRAEDDRFKILRLARNFRTDGGLTAGLSVADGDAAVIMAADLQDPPELIPEFLARWEEGYDNVYGIIKTRQDISWLRRINSSLFYWVIGRIADQPIPSDANDFRLLDKKVYEEVRKMQERNRFVRGLVGWLGFRSIGVEFDRPGRYAGQSKAHSRLVTEIAIRAVFAHSLAPLLIMPLLGLSLFGFSLAALIALTINWIANGVPFPGFGTIVALIILVFAVLVCLISILGFYIALIYEEVRGRPNFVVKERVGFD